MSTQIEERNQRYGYSNAMQEMRRDHQARFRQHMELSGFRQMWQIDDAIHRAYDLGEGEEPEPVISDKEYVEGLLAEGRDIIDGGCNTVPELNLPRLHDFPDLDHMGFGDFKNASHLFLRCDSPRSTRFYERTPKESVRPVTIPA
jgi:hypothetical protein